MSDSDEGSPSEHLSIQSVEDLVVFKLARLVGVNERSGARWSQALFDLSLNAWRMLALTHAHSPVRAGDVADMMLMDKSQFSRLIKTLSARGLLKSKPDPKDARAVVLSLTGRGKSLYARMMAEAISRNNRVLAPLSALEVKMFDEMLDRLITHNLARLAQE